MPKARTELYAIYRACERFHLIPPEVKLRWDENYPLVQATLIAYSQIREVEEVQNANIPD